MSENPVRESEPKSKNSQVAERAPPQSHSQVSFAQYHHGNAESSTSWPHAHTHTLARRVFGCVTYTYTNTVKHLHLCDISLLVKALIDH